MVLPRTTTAVLYELEVLLSSTTTENLMVFYWHGNVSLEDKEDLIAQFFMTASDSLRSHAIDFIGRSLSNTKDTVPVEILDRLQALWLWRLDIARASATPSQFAAELGSFGWWFISEKLDNSWILGQLKEALLLGAKLEPSHKVAEQLAKLATSTPKIVIECLRLAVENDKERWHIYSWRDPARDIILAALQSTDKDAQRKATEFVNHLIARGFLDFRDLINRSDGRS